MTHHNRSHRAAIRARLGGYAFFALCLGALVAGLLGHYWTAAFTAAAAVSALAYWNVYANELTDARLEEGERDAQ